MSELPEVVKRMQNESAELSERLGRASAFTLTETFKHLPIEERELFNEQVRYMQGYLNALDQRTVMIRNRLGSA